MDTVKLLMPDKHELSPQQSRASVSFRQATLYIQKDNPGPDKEANWLPAPNGTIYLVMRLYWPKTEGPSALPAGSGTWAPPEVTVAKQAGNP